MSPADRLVCRARGLTEVWIVLLAAMTCACRRDDCVELGDRAAALQEGGEVDCGVSDHVDDPKAHEIALCLSEHLEACTPASGRFLARPAAGDYWTLHIVIIDATCDATMLVMVDPASPADAFTEAACKALEPTGDVSVVMASECGEKTSYPRCNSSS